MTALRKLSSAVVNMQMYNLLQRLSFAPGSERKRVIAFIAARSGEGTSTVAREYAAALTAETGKNVLFVDAATPAAETNIVSSILAGRSPEEAAVMNEDGVATAYWMRSNENRSKAASVMHNPDFWTHLTQRYDSIIFDLPSLQHSFESIMLAAKADASVVVVAAEETPAPVAKHLCDTLAAAGAKLAGVVMNKRRYHIPGKVYEKL
jgi:Mrp family chromosome partitioning ATPase